MDLAALALTPWLVAVQGFRFGVGNDEITIANIRRVLDPNWLRGDWVLSTPPMHPLIVQAVAPLCGWFGESWTFLVLHLATRWLLLAGMWRLTAALAPRSGWMAGVAAMALTLFEPRLRIGSHYLQGGNWNPAFVGMALSVWILAACVRFSRREAPWWQVAVAGGLGSLLHFFINLPLLGVCVVAAAAIRRDWRASAAALVVATAIALPSLAPAVIEFLRSDNTGLTSADVIRILQFRHPHHHQPWTWPPTHFMAGAAVLAAVAWTWRRAAESRQVRRSLVVPAVYGVFFVASCVLFVVCGRLRVLSVVAYFQAFRMFSLFLVLFMIAMAVLAERAAARHPIVVVSVVFCVAALAMRAGGSIGVVAASAATALAARWIAEPEISPHPQGGPSRRAIAFAAVAGFLLVVALHAVPPLRAAANRAHREHWLAEVVPAAPDRAALAAWVRADTPADALFAAPPLMSNVRLYEERAIIADMKVVPYRGADLKEWAERIEALGGGEPLIPFAVPAAADPSAARLIDAARRYGARYVIAREASGPVLDDPRIVYRNKTYAAFDLEWAPWSLEEGILKAEREDGPVP